MSCESKDTFCPLPWTSMALHPSGRAQVCCISNFIGDTSKESLAEIWNSDKLKKLRVDMLNGIENDICKSCYSHEKLGANSSRLNWNKIFDTVRNDIVTETKIDGTLDRFELNYVDVRFNNLCNFKCRSCDPVYSSRIASESKRKQVLRINSDDVVAQFKSHYPYLKQIYFAGGEPMIQQEHWNMLSDLISRCIMFFECKLDNPRTVYSKM
jgi:MoaA/NifB/PqqE/SkfB family radical SAM enzyme